MADSNGLPMVISVLALVIGIIAIILGGVSLNRQGDNTVDGETGTTAGQTGSQSRLSWTTDMDGINNADDDKIWLMSIGDDSSKWEYLDEKEGQIRGFNVDIINAVCKIAGKNCRLVADVYQRCWNSQVGERQRGGEGLQLGYYDACSAWQHSFVRARTFQFSKPFAKQLAGVFVTKKGDGSFNWRDITGMKIGFIDGFVFDEICLAREHERITGASIPANLTVHFPSRDALVAAVNAGEVDAGFDAREAYLNSDILEVVSEDIRSCTAGGFGMMLRKDSTMWQWFNPALDSLMQTTEYRTICNDLLDTHSEIPGPPPESVCIGF